jgi:hypothetical protein
MQKTFVLTFLILINFLAYSQEKIIIKFFPGTPGNYDILIKNILEMNGYSADIIYNDNVPVVKFDYYLTYSFKSDKHEKLENYNFQLFSNEMIPLNQTEHVFPRFGYRIGVKKNLCQELGKIVEKNFNCNKIPKNSNFYRYDGTSVFKLDSASYFIIKWGAAIQKLDQVERNFIKQAEKILTEFDYYFESSKYK